MIQETSYCNIASHTGTTTLGCFVVCVDVTADVTLQEAEDKSLWFDIVYRYSGAKRGSGTTRVGPITGNASGSKDVGGDVTIKYAITNFQRSDTDVSLDLSASIEYDGTVHLGPDAIFENTRFAGKLCAAQAERNRARMESYAALHALVEKATGASVTSLYPRAT